MLYAFRDLIPILRSGAGHTLKPDETMLGETTPGDQSVVMEAADELAARGRFVEAMHMLLHGLAHIRQRLDRQFSDSLTSREILHGTDLPEAAQASGHPGLLQYEVFISDLCRNRAGCGSLALRYQAQ
jgi:hypothetical protein